MTRAINLLLFNFVSVGANSRVSKVCTSRRPSQRDLRSLPCRREREKETSTAVRSVESVGAFTRLKESPERHIFVVVVVVVVVLVVVVVVVVVVFTYIFYFDLLSPALVRSTWPLWCATQGSD